MFSALCGAWRRLNAALRGRAASGRRLRSNDTGLMIWGSLGQVREPRRSLMCVAQTIKIIDSDQFSERTDRLGPRREVSRIKQLTGSMVSALLMRRYRGSRFGFCQSKEDHL